MALSRREFVAGTLALAGGLSLGCGNDVTPAPPIDGAVDDDPASSSYGQVAIGLADVAALMPIGGAVTVRLKSPVDGRARPFRVPSGILLIHRGAPADPPEYAALESTCTHASCPLGYSARDQLVECPCHGSRFRAAADVSRPGSCAGEPTHLPARQGPTVFAVSMSGDLQTLYISLTQTLGCRALPPLVDGKVTVAIADEPALASPGGAVVGTAAGFTDPLALVRVDAATVRAVNARCTHLGCTLAWTGAKLQCPCHESAFDLDGKVLGGPAPRDTATYPVAFDGSTIVVTLLS